MKADPPPLSRRTVFRTRLLERAQRAGVRRIEERLRAAEGELALAEDDARQARFFVEQGKEVAARFARLSREVKELRARLKRAKRRAK